jgi:ABC-type transport system involved in cytochrome c biogenesis ATPase subunit
MGLVTWAAGQPGWVGDSLRRIAVSAHHILSDEDEADILARVRAQAAGSTTGALACAAIEARHLPGAGAGFERTVLAQLGPLKHVDRLAQGQILRFAPTGITLVYGENGSGKSGYTRIAKKFCRSLTADELKGDVFAQAAKQQMEIQVRYKVGDDPVETLDWTPGEVTPSELLQISVFDSHNARLYVDQQNRIAYLPAEIAILEHHAALCDRLSAKLATESADLDRRLRVAIPAGYSPLSRVAALLQRLDPKATLPTRDELEQLAGISTEEAAELTALEVELALDPMTRAATRRRAKQVLERFAATCLTLDTALSLAAADRLAELRRDAHATAEAARLVAQKSFAFEPLAGVGGDAWRQLYDTALDYIVSSDATYDAARGLPAASEDRCLLCQEPLGETGGNRLARFNAFVQGETARRADAAQAMLNGAATGMADLEIPAPETAAENLVHYAGSGAEARALVNRIGAAFAAYDQRRTLLLATITDPLAIVPALPATLTSALTIETQRLEAEAKDLDKKATHTAGTDAKRQRLESLKDRVKLEQDLAVVLQRLDDLVALADITACKSQMASRPISAQVSALRKELVTKQLGVRIKAEIAALDLGYLPFVFSDSSQQGKSLFGVGLETASKIKNNQVLSEGEQRALALACFLAEIGDATTSYGLIIDDPVSSLDNVRIRKVAARLAAEAAKGRQVIIFTHNLVFFNEMIAEAAKLGAAAPLITNIVRKSATDGFGIIEENSEPWVARGVNARITGLKARAKSLASETDFTTDTYRRQVKDFYSDLRESWERVVEEVVLNKTIERLVPDVKTQSLKGVAVTDDDYRIIFFAMKRASERSGHDMPAARDMPAPTPAEMQADVDALDSFRAACTARRKELEKTRKDIESPAAAALI